MTLTAARRTQLLRAAREAIEHALAGKTPRPKPSGPPSVAHGGIFVSLHLRANHELRGCIGSMEACEPLADTVAEAAVAAATRDRRFAPLRLEELPLVEIQISLLEPLRPVRPDEVQVGADGLLVRDGKHSGLLLPQVAVEHGWDRETFLRMTCRKAGVAEDAWRRSDCVLLAFRAEVFGE